MSFYFKYLKNNCCFLNVFFQQLCVVMVFASGNLWAVFELDKATDDEIIERVNEGLKFDQADKGALVREILSDQHRSARFSYEYEGKVYDDPEEVLQCVKRPVGRDGKIVAHKVTLKKKETDDEQGALSLQTVPSVSLEQVI